MTKELLIPVRIDLIGGWSDQLTWPYPAAVINASIGWEGGYEGGYPIRIRRLGLDCQKVESVITGVGTGLGISSILEAGKVLIQNPDADYIQHVLDWEQSEGTCGGWQDQIGAVAPGLKLITTDDHKNFSIKTGSNVDVMNHIVLFDTGSRRRSKKIGDKVRRLFHSESFVDALKQNVASAIEIFDADPRTFALGCCEGWQRLVRLFPGMDIEPPQTELVWGHKLVGAGGGGYGVGFVEEPDERDEIIDLYAKHGWWATKPMLLDGILHK